MRTIPNYTQAAKIDNRLHHRRTIIDLCIRVQKIVRKVEPICSTKTVSYNTEKDLHKCKRKCVFITVLTAKHWKDFVAKYPRKWLNFVIGDLGFLTILQKAWYFYTISHNLLLFAGLYTKDEELGFSTVWAKYFYFISATVSHIKTYNTELPYRLLCYFPSPSLWMICEISNIAY